MYKPDDKDIDRLSRDAAEQYHAPGKPSWDTLQHILDKELPLEKEKKRRGFFFFFFLLLGISVAGTGVWYGLHINANNNTVTTATASPKASQTKPAGNTVSPAEEVATAATAQHDHLPATGASTADLKNKPAGSKKTAGENSLPGNKATAALTEPATQKDIASKNNNQPPAPGNKKLARKGGVLTEQPGPGTIEKVADAGVNDVAHAAPVRKKQGNGLVVPANKNSGKKRSGNKENGLQHIAPETTAPAITAENNTTDIAKNETVVPGKNNDQTTAVVQDTSHQVTVAADPLAPVAKDPVISKTDSAIAAKKKSKSKTDRAINIGITGGLDASTVKFKYGENAGYNIGIMGGYQFSKHWSAYTGVLYTKKNYKLKGEDYHPPKHYWTQYVQLETVDGYCRMWELPLQVRYTFNPGSKTAFFASTGLSSYFMKRQAYNYSYKTMGVPATAYWVNDSTFNHVFSILHLSAGFEKQLGKHLNWQVEPYAKIPLGGVGFGDIRLSSFGINFTVQYRHPVKR